MKTAITRKVALVTGVGPGTGSAIVRRLVGGGYHVAMVARDRGRLAALEAELVHATACALDVTDPVVLASTVASITTQFGAPALVVHNAVAGAFGSFLAIEPDVLERNFRVNVMALMHLARLTAPAMVAAGHGAIVVTGNTSALRGKPAFAGFAPTKAAQRILAESIARDLGPKGVHVAYVVIDAVIDLPWTRKTRPDAPDSFFIKPDEIAAEIWHVAHQPRGAWSFNVELRPFAESW